MKHLPLVLLFFLVFTSCSKVDVPKGTPSCIKQKIRKMEKDKERYGGTTVECWELSNGDKYYVFGPDRKTADGYADLFDDQCNLVCHPYGGITGKGAGDCPDLSDRKVYVIYQFPE